MNYRPEMSRMTYMSHTMAITENESEALDHSRDYMNSTLTKPRENKLNFDH